MAYQVKVEIGAGRSYTVKSGKRQGLQGFISDCIIRDDERIFADVHFSDEPVKPGLYVAEVAIGQDANRKRTFFLNNLRPLAAPAAARSA